MITEDFYRQGFNKDSDIIIFFAPDAGVVPHYVAQCIVAKTLQEKGYQVRIVRCSGLFSRCPVMDSVGARYDLSIEQRHNFFCNSCQKVSHFGAEFYGLEAIDLRDFIPQETFEEVNQLVDPYAENLLDFHYDDIAFGQAAAFDIHLNLKLIEISNPSARAKNAWLQYTKSCLLAYLGIKNLSDVLPLKRIVAFNKYSIQLASTFAAKFLKIPFLNITMAAHKDIDRKRFMILPEVYNCEMWGEMVRQWRYWRDLAIPTDFVKEITDDMIQRQRGRGFLHYSPGKTLDPSSIWEDLKIDKGRKLLVAYTSTLDENLSEMAVIKSMGIHPTFQRIPFENQIIWLTALTEYVSASDDLQLIVRVHPRESSNKRERRSSEHLVQLRAAFDRPISNCQFIWPKDKVSSYDLAEMADLCLTSLSTLGMEVSKYGVPVVTCMKGYHYVDDDFLEWGGPTKEDYIATIRNRLETPLTLESIKRSFRAYAYQILYTSMNLGDIYPDEPIDIIEFPYLPRETEAIERVFMEGTSFLDQNFVRLQAQQSLALYAEEEKELRKQLLRFVHFSLTGEDIHSEPKTTVVLADSMTQAHLERIAVVDGPPLLFAHSGIITYFYSNKRISRISPALYRLAVLCATSKEQRQ